MSEVNSDKPCPFCGSSTVQTTVDDGCQWSSCPKCSATGPTEFLRSDEDSPGWNTRPEFDRVTAERDAALAENKLLRHDVASCLETVAKVCDMLGVDLELAKTAEGKPSDVLFGYVSSMQQRLTAADERVDVLGTALRFYAEREHYHFESGNWDTVSGEPLNILWCGDEPDFIEDGTVARNALFGSSEPGAPKCRYCGDTGQFMIGSSGDSSDGNAPIMTRCEDCELGEPVVPIEFRALAAFVGAACPVANQINKRGYNWCESYLDAALVLAQAALKPADARCNIPACDYQIDMDQN